VHRLESLPVDASFPSGHTAASLALYGGLVLLLASRVRSVWTSWTAGIVLLIVPAFVAWSRMYRGMHHLTDSIAGILLGLGAISVTVFAVRVGGATDDRRRALSHERCD
jgi:undecaprenyl-diphosphatase